MKYRTLLFDVDDTLLDFQAAETEALHRLFASEKLTLTPKLEQDYKTMNEAMWRAYEVGSLTREEVVNQRFGKFFGNIGRQVDSVAMEERYRFYLDQGHQLLGNSYGIVQDLSKKADLYLVTNGTSSTQYQRLTASGLLPFFKQTFISEDIGSQKPTRAFFTYVFQHIPDFDKKTAVIIGDSLTSDIQGGIAAGIDTVWLNAGGKVNGSGILPTYEIKKLEELYLILES